MARDEVPVFVNVTGWLALVVPDAWFENVKLAGEKLTVFVTVPVPVPLSGSTCGVPAALSATVNVPEIAPVVLGVNVRLMVQVLLAATVPAQVVADTAKSPLVEIVPIVRGTLELVSVTLFAVLVLPTAVLPKVSEVGESVTGVRPLPVRLTT